MSSGRLRVLVTATGADLGQSIVKALRLSSRQVDCFGCDMAAGPQSVGGAFVEQFERVPAANASDFLEILDELCRRWSIDAVIPGSEPEIMVLSSFPGWPRLAAGPAVVCHPAAWIRNYGDKLICMRSLEGRVELAPFADGHDPEALRRLTDEVGFPLVVKERSASGSTGLRSAATRQELDEAVAQARQPVVQRYIDDSGGEFSVGVFAHEQFESAIAFRRELGPGGASWFAETVDDEDVLDYAMKVAKAAGLRGSANVQVRKSRDGVRLLEINPRFSSLAAARAFCGFHDVQWELEAAIGLPLTPPTPGGYRRMRFRRFLHELVDTGHGYGGVPEWSPRPWPAAGQDRRADQ